MAIDDNFKVGRLVIMKGRPEEGVARIERLIPEQDDRAAHGRPLIRVFFYSHGRFRTFSPEEIEPAPPGAPRFVGLFQEEDEQPKKNDGEAP